MASGRDDTLRALLASTGSDYSYEALSETEIAALECALGDGFGDVGSIGYQPAPMPSQIKSGLLRHSFYIRENSEYDYEGRPDEFWEWNDDRPPPSEFFPLNFVLRRLRLYFENQLDRLCKSLIQQAPELASLERSELVLNAASRLYEKPWYEFHAVQ